MIIIYHLFRVTKTSKIISYTFIKTTKILLNYSTYSNRRRHGGISADTRRSSAKTLPLGRSQYDESELASRTT